MNCPDCRCRSSTASSSGPAASRRGRAALLFGKPPTIDGQTLSLRPRRSSASPSCPVARCCLGGRSDSRRPAPGAATRLAVDRRPPIPMAEVRAVDVPGPAGPLPSRLYVPHQPPNDAAAPLLVYYHGGGWVIGDLDTHDGVCRLLAAAAGGAGALDRLPAGPRASLPGADRRRLRGLRVGRRPTPRRSARTRRGSAVGGDSAGGNMAAVVSQMAREGGGAAARDAAADLPGHRLGSTTPARAELFAEGFILTAADMEKFEAAYLPPGCRPHRPARLDPPVPGPAQACRPPTSPPPASIRCATRARPTR